MTGVGALRERDQHLVDRGVLPQRQVPKAAANLVSALANWDERKEKRIDIRLKTSPLGSAPTEPSPFWRSLP